MRLIFGWMCICIAVFAAPTPFSQGMHSVNAYEWISSGIEEVVDSVDPTALVGVKVVSLDDGKVYYEKNGERRFVPASTLKLLTMGAALDVLGEEYCFKTELKAEGVIHGGALSGDLYLVGSGDPSLRGLDLLELVEGLNLREIRGDLILDLSCFEDGPMGPGWMWDEEPGYWSVPTSALNVEHNFVGGEVVHFPEKMAASIVKGLLDRKGILLRGELREGRAPEGAMVLGSHRSEPLKRLIQPVLQDSDNLYSDCIFKAMGGSWKKGKRAVEEFLRREIELEALRIVDGSGLSRYNLVSPSQMVSALQFLEGNQTFKEALPVGRECGTLKHRMCGFGGCVAAKTGSMTGVSSLCGYVTAESGERFVVAVMVNGYLKEGREIKSKIEDEICRILVNCPR